MEPEDRAFSLVLEDLGLGWNEKHMDELRASTARVITASSNPGFLLWKACTCSYWKLYALKPL